MTPGGRAAAAALTAALALAALWNAAGFWPDVVDDGYISLRYARSIAEGLGATFNPGERVEGYSNPTWVALLALTLAAGPETLVGGKLLGLASHGALIVCAVGLARELARAPDRDRESDSLPAAAAAIACCGFLAVSLPMSWWPVTGMETTFYAAMLVGTFWRLAVELRGLKAGETPAPISAGLAGLTAITRPEAPLLLLGAVIARLVAGPRGLKGWLGIFAVPTLGYLLFRLLYFGFLFPNTYYEKRDDGVIEGVEPSLLKADAALDYLAPWVANEWLYAGLCLVGLAAVMALRPRRAWPLALAVGAQLFFLFWKGYDWMANQRFLVPALPLMTAAMGAAAAIGAARLKGAARWAPAGLALLLVGAQASTSLDYRRVKNIAGQRAPMLDERRDIHWFPRSLDADWSELDRVTAWALARIPPGASVAYTEIGMIGWVADYVIVDLAGLTDKELSGATGRSARQQRYYLKKRQVDWIILKDSGEKRLKALRREDWLAKSYSWEVGLKGALVARRKGSKRATPQQALENFALAVTRSPRNLRMRWEWMAWTAALASAPEEVAGLCADFAQDFPLAEAYTARCETHAAFGRAPPSVAPVPYKKPGR